MSILRPSRYAMTFVNALSIIRPFTNEDDLALSDSALRFSRRYGLLLDTEEKPWQALECELWSRPDEAKTRQLRRLWQGCFCRALDLPVSADTAVAYGYVGRRA